MASIDYMQPPCFPPKSGWIAPSISTLPSWAGAQRIAIDVETRDEQLKELGPGVRRGAYVVGVSFAIEDAKAYYLPIRHLGGDNLNPEQVWSYLKDQGKSFHGDLVTANGSYDLDFLAQAGVTFAPRFHRDVQVAEPLLDELQFSYSLENIALRHGLPAKQETLLRLAADRFGVHPKAELWKLPARYVGPYAEQDARLPLALLRLQEKRIEAEGLWGIYDLESRVLPILVKMRRRGVRIDLTRLDEVERWAIQEETAALDRVRTLSGVSLAFEDVWDAEALSRVLAGMGLTIPITPKTHRPSVKKDFLRGIPGDLPRAVERARKIDKVRRDFVRTIREHLVGDRIHCTFNQLRATKDDGDDMGTITGRVSCGDPNMQQVQGRDEELGPLCRGVFIPDEGCQWASCDFSSQEPRCTIHYAVKARCQGAEAMAKRFRENPRTDLHQATADLCGICRKDAKIIFLGIAYGMGGAKLCRSLGLPTERTFSKRQKKEIDIAGPAGQAILDRFHEMVPFVRELSGKVQATGARRGYIKTLGGRHCHFPIDEEKSTETYREYMHLQKALNKLIQGSSADQMKTAMVHLDRAGLTPQLQLHDEICESVRDRAQAEEIARIMEHAVELVLPSVVDVEIGPSWGEAK